MKPGQKYQQGLVIQHSVEGSAFQEAISAVIDENGVFEANLPGGIKKISVKTTIEAGEPVEVDILSEASEDYEGLAYKYDGKLYICKETSEDVYEWVEQVDKDSQLGLPLVYSSYEDLPEPGVAYVGKFAKIDGMDIHFYLCIFTELTGDYEWCEVTVISGE